MKRIEAVIWDWNGTLLNDLHISLHTINQLLSERNLIPLSRERYLELFTFPVIDYYEKIGFDFSLEPFEIPARQFTDIYNVAVRNCGLHSEAFSSLAQISKHGIKQFILSAMEQPTLNETVSQNNIAHFFEKISGLDNNFAVSKIEKGEKLMSEYRLKPDKTVLIGDTVHDYEVAEKLKCHCILVANGHQSKQRLARTGAKIVDDISEILLW